VDFAARRIKYIRPNSRNTLKHVTTTSLANNEWLAIWMENQASFTVRASNKGTQEGAREPRTAIKRSTGL